MKQTCWRCKAVLFESYILFPHVEQPGEYRKDRWRAETVCRNCYRMYDASGVEKSELEMLASINIKVPVLGADTEEGESDG